MATLALERDALLPRRPRGFGRGLVLAVIAHLLLVAALSFSVNWHSSVPDAAEADAQLWAAVPQAAAPRAVEPPPQPVTPPLQPPPPTPRAEPAVTPPPVEKAAPKELPDAQIALERERREQRKRDELKREEQERAEQKRADQKLAKAQAEKDRMKQLAAEAAKDAAKDAAREAAKEAAEKARQTEKLAAQRQKQEAAKVAAQAARIEAQRSENLKRIAGMAGGSANPNATGTAAQSAGPSASYIGRIRGRIRPNVIFPDTLDGNPAVEVDLRMAAGGRIISSRIVKPSGSPEWDEAILRAVQKTEILPADENGRVPPALTLVYRLRD